MREAAGSFKILSVFIVSQDVAALNTAVATFEFSQQC
jgi:hypothetical protein